VVQCITSYVVSGHPEYLLKNSRSNLMKTKGLETNEKEEIDFGEGCLQYEK
jgi:hypothetical protein